MLNRRIIRIKVFKELFANVNQPDRKMAAVKKEFLDSCTKTRDLYYFMFNILPILKAAAQERIDAGLKKFNPSEEEKNPNLKFVNNRVIALIENDAAFGSYCSKARLSWSDNDILYHKIFSSISASDYYAEYMASDSDSLEEDCRLVQNIFAEEFEDCEMLEDLLERMSVMWIDDLGYVLNTIISNIDILARSGKLQHPTEIFPNEETRGYALKLLELSLLDYDRYAREVGENVTNWDKDRIVSTDLALIVQGLVEAVNFQDIPMKVTINEYVEISKYYSTAKSRVFVNGLLDKMIQQKLLTGEIVKSGMGLREN